MKKYLFCIIIPLILQFIISCEAKPSAVFEETVFDFGKTVKETTLKHTFSFKNTGTAVLVIDRIKTG